MPCRTWATLSMTASKVSAKAPTVCISTAGCLTIGPPETVWRLAYLARNDFISPGAGRSAESESVLAVDIGGTKLAAGLVDRTGQWTWAAQAPTPAGGRRRSGPTLEDLLVAPAGRPAAGMRDRIWRAHVVRRGAGLPAQHSGLAGLSLAGPAGRADRPAHLDRQRRQSPGPGRRVGGRSGRACATTCRWSVSTGIGGGIVLDGRLLDGDDGNAGHIGHVVVEPAGRRCACGGQGCLEAEASGNGHRRHHRREPRRGRAGGRWSGPARWSAGRWPAWPICSTCSWRRSADRWRSASGSRSSPRPEPSSRPGPACSSRADCRIVRGRLGRPVR